MDATPSNSLATANIRGLFKKINARLLFDIVFGIIVPVLYLIFEYRVLGIGWLYGLGLMAGGRILYTLPLAINVVFLSFWLVFSKKLALWGGLFGAFS